MLNNKRYMQDMIIECAIVLAVAAFVSYYLLTLIKPLHLWQSTGIMFCLVFIYGVAANEMEKRRNIGFTSAGEDLLQEVAQTVQQPAMVGQFVSGVTQNPHLEHISSNGSMQNAVTATPAEANQEPGPPPHLVKPKAQNALEALIFDEIEALNDLTYAHGIDAPIYYSPSQRDKAPWVASTLALRYTFQIVLGQKASVIENLQDEIENELTKVRERHGIKGEVSITFGKRPLSVIVPHPNPAKLVYEDQTGEEPGLIDIGMIYNITEQKAVINLEETPHVVAAGMSGYGKSNLLRVILTSLFQRHGPEKLKAMLIDLKARDFGILADAPHVLTYVTRVEQAEQVLRDARIEFERRKAIQEELDKQGKRITATFDYTLIVAIDELAVLKSSDAREVIAELLNMGRDFDIHLLAGVQSPTSDVIGKEAAKAFSMKLVSHLDNARAAANIAGAKSGAERIAVRGQFLMISDGETRMIQVYELSREANRALIDKLAAAAPKPVAPSLPANVVAVFREYFNVNTNDLDRGGRTAAKVALFGETNVAKSGGKATAQAQEVERLFNLWITEMEESADEQEPIG